MNRKILLLLLILSLTGSLQTPVQVSASASYQPVLKWAYKGCDSKGHCETAWYSSPAVVDLDSDGKAEVIGAAYKTVVLDGETGALEWSVSSGHDRSQPGAAHVGRTWPDIVAVDMDNDGKFEIVTAHDEGWVGIYNEQGYFEPGWPQQLTSPDEEYRAMAAYDLEGDGRVEVILGSTADEYQYTVLEPNGSPHPGLWPQMPPEVEQYGRVSGNWNQNMAIGDLNGDGKAEIFASNDTQSLSLFQENGAQMRANPVYGAGPDGLPKLWWRVGVHLEHAIDVRGYANCGVDHRPNFDDSAPLVVDLNNDGVLELAVVGNVYNCDASPYQSLYEIPFIFHADRTRWKAGGYDWTVPPVPEPGYGPKSEDYNRIKNNHPTPVAADLDGNGIKELIYPSYDGRMHAYWMDRTQHGNWPYTIAKAGEGIRFATEPVVADLNNDGQAEVIFASWPEIASNQVGKLHILSSMGEPIYELSLPAGDPGSTWNGTLAAPTLANIDSDMDWEVVLNTVNSGLVAYDLTNTTDARILWATGRGGNLRSGSLLPPDLRRSAMRSGIGAVEPGVAIPFEITIRNMGPVPARLWMNNPLPAGLTYIPGSLSATWGTATQNGSAITWTGNPPIGTPVTIRYKVQLTDAGGLTGAIKNVAMISDNMGNTWQVQAHVIADPEKLFLPFLRR